MTPDAVYWRDRFDAEHEVLEHLRRHLPALLGVRVDVHPWAPLCEVVAAVAREVRLERERFFGREAA